MIIKEEIRAGSEPDNSFAPFPSHRIRLTCGRMFHAMQAVGGKRDSRWLLLAGGSAGAEAEQGGVRLAGKEDGVPC